MRPAHLYFIIVLIIGLLFMNGCLWSKWRGPEKPDLELNSKAETVAVHIDGDIVSMVVVSAKDYKLGNRIRLDIKSLDTNMVCNWDATVPPNQTMDQSLLDSRETSDLFNFFTPKRTGKHMVGIWCVSSKGSVYILLNVYVERKKVKIETNQLIKTDAVIIE